MNSATRPPPVVVRPIRPGDLARLARMWDRLSPESIYRRFHSPIRTLTLAAARRLVTVDHHDRDALIALIDTEAVGVARYDRSPDDPARAELAVLIEDAWQGRGLGQRLLRDVIELAARRGVRVFAGDVQGDNHRMLRLVRALTAEPTFTPDGGSYRVQARPADGLGVRHAAS